MFATHLALTDDPNRKEATRLCLLMRYGNFLTQIFDEPGFVGDTKSLYRYAVAPRAAAG